MGMAKDQVRLELRVSKTTHKMLEAIAAKMNKSLNEVCNRAIYESLKVSVLSGMLGPENARELPEAVLVAQIARIEAAQNAAEELRWLGMSGSCSTYEEFMFLKKNVSPDIRRAIDKDIDEHGPLEYRKPNDPDRLMERPKTPHQVAIDAVEGLSNDLNADGTVVDAGSAALRDLGLVRGL